MLIYQMIVTAILLLLLLNTLNNQRWLRRPARRPPPPTGPLVSLLIPARNEANTIAHCVTSLALQDYPACEILVLDDQSEDETAEIVATLAQQYPRVRLLRGQPLPPGWHGKAYACAQLAHAAHGEWLLFVDADTVHSPACVSTAVRIASARQADLLTMMPHIVTGSFGEALLLPIITLVFGGVLPMGWVMCGSSPLLAGALGPFLLFRRASYWRIGGHAAVRQDIVEDMQLSRLVKQHGGQLVWINGTDLMQVRFYRGSGQAWRGLGKSAFAAINYSVPFLLLGLACCSALFCAPYAFFIIGLLNAHGSLAPLWLPLIQIVLLICTQWLLAQRWHLPRALAFLQVVTMLAVIMFTLTSAYSALWGKGTTWKGRTYQFGAQRTITGMRTHLAALLLIARLMLATFLFLLAWHVGNMMLGRAAFFLLISWTGALLAQGLANRPERRWASYADSGSAAISLFYLLFSGLLHDWHVVMALFLLIGEHVLQQALHRRQDTLEAPAHAHQQDESVHF